MAKTKIALQLSKEESKIASKKLGEPPRAASADRLQETHGWVQEPEDELVPKDGWLSDFVLSKRGWESPTLFGLWAGLGILSGIMKRDAYLEWADDKLIPNVYLIYVGPPAVVRKSFTVGMISDFLYRWPDFLDFKAEKIYKLRKKLEIIEGATTVEKVFEDLGNPQDTVVIDEESKVKHTINGGSAGVMIVPELTTVLSRDNRQAGTMLDYLCDWYDCKAIGSQHRTRQDGEMKLRNLYFSFVAATTPTAVRAHLPQAALGGGFLSRTLFLYMEETKRRWSRPMNLPGCPTRDILQERMLWCMKNADGAFKLTPEAEQWYDTWYERYHAAISAGDELYRNVHGRMAINLLKVAILLRAQEYRKGRDICVWHLELAAKLVEMSLASSMKFLAQLQTNPLYDMQELVKGFLGVHKERSLGQIQRAFVKRMDTATLVKVIQNLWLQEAIVITHNGKTVPPTYNGNLDARFVVRLTPNKDILQNLDDEVSYNSIQDHEIDEENMHRPHPLTKEDLIRLELQVMNEIDD